VRRDDGITTLFMPPSAIPHLLEEAMGVEGFYCLLTDYPDEMDALIRTIQETELSRFVLGAFSDGIATPLERFLAVRDYVEGR